MATDIPGFPQNRFDYKVTLYNGAALLSPIVTPTAGLQNGMVWTTSAGLFARINGATVGPYIASASITGWTATLVTSSPNNTVNASRFLASGGTTDQDAVIEAKGIGATQGQLADGTLTGGNKRGQYAVDWQRSRSLNSRVASGAQSTIIGGIENEASGASAVAGGNACIASGTGSIAVGASNTASQQAATAFGFSSEANGIGAFAAGWQAIASGNYSLASGFVCSADAESSASTGSWGHTQGIIGKSTRSAAHRSVQGDCQAGHYPFGPLRTTNATPAVLTTDGAAASTNNQIILQNNSSIGFRGTVIARSATNWKTWEIKGGINRGANAATTTTGATGPTVTALDATAGAAAWVIGVTADTTNGGLAITATGAAATTIDWGAEVSTFEIF